MLDRERFELEAATLRPVAKFHAKSERLDDRHAASRSADASQRDDVNRTETACSLSLAINSSTDGHSASDPRRASDEYPCVSINSSR